MTFDIARARAETPGTRHVTHFNNAGAGLMPTPVLDAVMAHLNVGARVIICGTASIAKWNPVPLGPRVVRALLVKRARMQGFVILDHRDHYAAARVDLADWVRQGLIQYEEDILDGIEYAPDAIAGLYRGENLGRRLIRVID